MRVLPTDDPLAVEAVAAIHAGDFATLRRMLTARPELVTVGLGGGVDQLGDGGMTRSLLHVATDWPGHFPTSPPPSKRWSTPVPMWTPDSPDHTTRRRWLITAGILIVSALAIVAPILRRSAGDVENCCPPTVTASDLVAEREPQAPLGSHRVTADAGPAIAGTNRTVPARAIPARPPSPGRPEAQTGHSRQRRTQRIPASSASALVCFTSAIQTVRRLPDRQRSRLISADRLRLRRN